MLLCYVVVVIIIVALLLLCLAVLSFLVHPTHFFGVKKCLNVITNNETCYICVLFCFVLSFFFWFFSFSISSVVKILHLESIYSTVDENSSDNIA